MATVNLKSLQQPLGETGASMGSAEMGGMAVISASWPANFDATELLKAACGDALCPVPHYVFVTNGALHIRYTDDGSEETANTGDAAYLRPGHTVWTKEKTDIIELSPADGNTFIFGRLAATGLL